MTHDHHGGEIYRLEKSIRDFSVNLNPLGFPKYIWQEMLCHPELATLYPDQECQALREDLGKALKLSADSILCGNGASELFSLITAAIKPSVGLVTAPAFSGYEHALKQAGARIGFHRLHESEDFVLTETFMESLTELKPEIAFLCQPNNPTGALTDRKLLERIMEQCEKQGTYLVLDICFLGFTDEDEQWLIKKLSTHPHLILVSAFTKLYAMPGIRLGYMLCDNRELVDSISEQQSEWSVSGIAQWVGRQMLKEKDYVRKAVEVVKEEREYLMHEMTAMGLKVYPSAANFILAKGDRRIADMLYKKGFLVRKAYNFKGLDVDYFRVAVKTHEENEELVQALQIMMADLITFQEGDRSTMEDISEEYEMLRKRLEIDMPEFAAMREEK